MSRKVNEKEYNQRRGQILDAAQRQALTSGFESMSIQNILDELQISKGAFYHYFDSRQALLQGLIDRMRDEAVTALGPILQDPGLPALEKLQRYFAATARWKTEHKAYLLSLLRVWYHDDNALVRQKVQASSSRAIAPMFAAIIQRGVAEGTFHAAYPEQTGEVVLTLMYGLGDATAELLLGSPPGQEVLDRMEKLIRGYTDALERVLGAPEGSLELMDRATLKEWADITQFNGS